jgi:hypothetical protein
VARLRTRPLAVVIQKVVRVDKVAPPGGSAEIILPSASRSISLLYLVARGALLGRSACSLLFVVVVGAVHLVSLSMPRGFRLVVFYAALLLCLPALAFGSNLQRSWLTTSSFSSFHRFGTR